MDRRDRAVRVDGSITSDVDERTIGRAGAVDDAVGADVREVAHARLGHLLADHAAAGGGHAAEVDRVRVLRLRRRQRRRVVGGGAGETDPIDDGPTEGLELLLEGVGDALSVGLGVIDDHHVARADVVVRGLRAGRTLHVVGRGQADIVDLVRVGLAHVERAVFGLGDARGGVGRAALQQARLVGHRNLGHTDIRVVGADHGDHAGVCRERGDVLGALLGIVDAVDGVVLNAEVDVVAVDAGRVVGIAQGELDAVEGRFAVGGFAAGQRQVDTELDGLAGVATGAGTGAGVRASRRGDDHGRQCQCAERAYLHERLLHSPRTFRGATQAPRPYQPSLDGRRGLGAAVTEAWGEDPTDRGGTPRSDAVS